MAYNIAQNAIQLPADRASGMLKTCMLIPPSCFHPADRQPAEQSLCYNSAQLRHKASVHSGECCLHEFYSGFLINMTTNATGK